MKCSVSSYRKFQGCDLSHDLLTFYSLVMLAQSQECILEKSMLDNRKSGISAKIASQIVEFYTKSINNLSSDVKSIVGSKIFQQWKRICEMKVRSPDIFERRTGTMGPPLPYFFQQLQQLEFSVISGCLLWCVDCPPHGNVIRGREPVRSQGVLVQIGHGTL